MKYAGGVKPPADPPQEYGTREMPFACISGSVHLHPHKQRHATAEQRQLTAARTFGWCRAQAMTTPDSQHKAQDKHKRNSISISY